MTSIHFALSLAEKIHLFSGKNKQTTKSYSSNDNVQFIKNIYKVSPETGNIDYCNCDCVNFPEYVPLNTRINK